MRIAYLNYPNPHIKLHAVGCGFVEKAHPEGQRWIRIDSTSVSDELLRFAARVEERSFAAFAGRNDMWLEVDFSDPAFEESVVRHIQNVLAQRYSPFGRVELTRCGCIDSGTA